MSAAVHRLQPAVPDCPEVLIRPGIYQAVYCYHVTLDWRPWRSNGLSSPKVALTFEVIGGEFNGIALKKFYNVASVDATALNGSFTPPNSSRAKLVSDMRRLTGWRAGPISLDFLRGKTLEIEVRTVHRGFREGRLKHERLPDHEQYSVVDRLVRIVETQP